jgi:hypothetical protein
MKGLNMMHPEDSLGLIYGNFIKYMDDDADSTEFFDTHSVPDMYPQSRI